MNGLPHGQPELRPFKMFVRILYFTLFATVGLYWFVLGFLKRESEMGELEILKPVFWAVGAVTALTVLFLRFSRIPTLLAGTSVELGQRLAQLRASYILCFVLAETVALYGFLLGLLGASSQDTLVFFLASAALFVLCYPHVPE
jgi:F0F1-type ATP synthase membrane subunit c/vacuolar-type H+-ATPase subunit K